MIITTGKSRRDTHWVQREVSWEGLVERLKDFKRTSETMAEYRAMEKDQQGDVKDVGGFVGGRIEGGRRKNSAVVDRCLVTLDADNAEPDVLDTIMWELGWAEWFCYSTHSHTPESPRLRFVFPLNRAVSPDEYEPIARKLAERIGIDMMDPTTYEVSRLMYWPSCSKDAVSTVVMRHNDARWVDPDEVLAEYGEGDAWKDSSLWPRGKDEGEIMRREAQQAGEPESKPGIVGLFNRTYDVISAIDTFLSDVYEPGLPGRYTYVKGSTANGAVVYEDGRFLYSHHGTDPASGVLCNAFDLVRIHLYGHLDVGGEVGEITQRASYKAMCEWAAELDDVKRKMVEENVGDMIVGKSDAEPEDNRADSPCEEDDSWKTELALNRKSGLVEPTIANATLILEHDPRLAGCIAFNELKGRPVIRKKLDWHPDVSDPLNGDNWKDADDSQLRLYMEKTWKLVGRNQIQDALNVVLDENSFDPVREYLDALTWDGVERVDTLLCRYMGAEDNPYVRAVTRKWMCAAIARVYVPGIQFDHMLVLAGPQGIGKSNLGRKLGHGWHTDSLGRLDNSKEAMERLAGKWIVEIAELAALKRAEIEDVKNFITKQTDDFRKAYGHHNDDHRRRCVFYGTTNNAEFLNDRTGARRFWIVDVPGIDHGWLPGLDEEVDQLWAEAKELWKKGEVLELTDETVLAYAKEMQDRHSASDILVDQVREFLDTPRPDDWETRSKEDRRSWYVGLTRDDREPCNYMLRRVCANEIYYELCGEDPARSGGNNILYRQIRNILNTLPGWVKGKQTHTTYGRLTVWERESD